MDDSGNKRKCSTCGKCVWFNILGFDPNGMLVGTCLRDPPKVAFDDVITVFDECCEKFIERIGRVNDGLGDIKG